MIKIQFVDCLQNTQIILTISLQVFKAPFFVTTVVSIQRSVAITTHLMPDWRIIQEPTQDFINFSDKGLFRPAMIPFRMKTTKLNRPKTTFLTSEPSVRNLISSCSQSLETARGDSIGYHKMNLRLMSHRIQSCMLQR
jgi:hypothetical protein